MKSDSQLKPISSAVIFVPYYVTLLVFLLASFFPQYRIWGINWWGYYPQWVPMMLFAVGVVMPLLLRFFPRSAESEANESRYFIITTVLIVVYGLAFYFLRARTHFLGDGYQILSILASDNPFIKPTELGEALVHLWVFQLLGGDSRDGALLSYQVVSITAGILFLIGVALFARVMFEFTCDRMLFVLGSASGGYMMLFFGYVENYSLYLVSMTIFTLTGVLAAQGKLSKWLILPPMALTIFFHILGVTLIPSAIYILVTGSTVSRELAKLRLAAKLFLALVAVVLLAVAFLYYYFTDYFFRFAFVPLFENRFTVEGYTMFSLKHLADCVNILILLLPGLPMIIVALFHAPLRKIIRLREYQYLLILLAFTLAAVFIFDPKLGMPRDWDMFAFAGVPLVISAYYLLSDRRWLLKPQTSARALLIALSLLILVPRIVSQTIPTVSIAHFEDYLTHDKIKNRTGQATLIRYYRMNGDEEAAELARERARQDFPEKQLFDGAIGLMAAGKIDKALPLLKRVLRSDALNHAAWTNVGLCQTNLGEFEEAIESFQIADGLNPYNPVVLNGLGYAYLCLHRYQKAEKALKDSYTEAPDSLQTLVNLVTLYALWQRYDEYDNYFAELSQRTGVSVGFLTDLGQFHIRQYDFKRAAQVYRFALEQGHDSAYVTKQMERYPQLKEAIKQIE